MIAAAFVAGVWTGLAIALALIVGAAVAIADEAETSRTARVPNRIPDWMTS